MSARDGLAPYLYLYGKKGNMMNLRRRPLILGLILALGILEPAHGQAVKEKALPTDCFDVRSFGATGDGRTLDTQAIQNAIRATNKAGGGTVVFAPGTYLSGTLELLSNVTLDVEAGAVILASEDLAQYGALHDFGFGHVYGLNATGAGEKVGLMVARNADNIAIIGQGAIDGNSDAFIDPNKPHYSLDFDPKYTRQGEGFMRAVLQTGDGPIDFKPQGRPGTMIVFFHCRNVAFRDVTLRNAPNWTLHLQTVDGAVMDGVHILNDLRIPNNDGVDCYSCRHAHFSNSDIRAGDDDFAIVGSEDITVTNCTLTSNSSGIRLEDTHSSVFSNLTIHANRGIAIYESGNGTTSSILFSGIVIDTHLLTGHWWGKGEPIYVVVGQIAVGKTVDQNADLQDLYAAPGKASGQGGVVRDIHFSNISAEAEGGIVLYGNPRVPMEAISFDGIRLHLRVTRKEVNAAVGGNFDFRWTADSMKTAVFAHDVPGLYARGVNGLGIHGMEVQWADAMPAYYSSALVVEDAENLSVDRIVGRQASVGSEYPVIALMRVNGVSIRNSSAAEGASTFLSTSQVTGEELFEGNNLSRAKRAFNTKTTFTLSGNLWPGKM
jgi:parallel beta-helix repeat protein